MGTGILISSIATNDSVWAPNIRRLGGAPSTPENNGLVVDRNNNAGAATQTTASLTSWGRSAIANGDIGELNGGLFATNDIVDWSGSNSDGSINIAGAGPQKTVILPSSNSIAAGLRINIPGNTSSKGKISNIGVRGPSRPASLAIDGVGNVSTNGKTAILLDATTCLTLDRMEADGFDIGMDLKNNCFNCATYDFSVPRTYNTNVGINIRTGTQSGSDLKFYNSVLSAYVSPVCAAGSGGGYFFYGGQFGAFLFNNATVIYGTGAPSSGTGSNGNYYIDLTADVVYGPKAAGAWPGSSYQVPGLLEAGWDYVSQTQIDDLVTLFVEGVSFEGIHASHAIRTHGGVFCQFHNCGFNPGNGFPDSILRMKSPSYSQLSFAHCFTQGAWGNPVLAQIDTGGSLASLGNEIDWGLGSPLTANGVNQNSGNPFFTLSWQSGYKKGYGRRFNIVQQDDTLYKFSGGHLLTSTNGTTFTQIA